MSEDLKFFYEKHKNFSDRRLTEYYLSPGIRCKFDLLRKHIKKFRHFSAGVDLGCSGNSFLYFTNKVIQKCFFDIATKPLEQYTINRFWNPLCGDISRLPYRNASLEFVSALDVLEHVSDDRVAISEISRILKKDGIVLVTVPHKMEYYTAQDRLIGHYRRYELEPLMIIFRQFNLIAFKVFGVYGQLMRVENIQSRDPEKLETSLSKLRNRYENNLLFQKIWNVFVWIAAKVMRIDVKHQHVDKIMNIGIFFQKTD
ncbi:MAG: class I SAM-dependent methyltransferase [Candidatus Lokiarchaeota archaeon]|nr:class I SAM-dependent methyltransferase [Candidatus Lokiarchaeota archaeon]